MLQSARKNMPAIDYVSIVRSVYKDRVAMLVGTVATAMAALAASVSAHSNLLMVHTALFLVVAFFRYREAMAFEAADIAPEDAAAAEKWEFRATLMGCIAALNYGLWCFSCLVLVDDAFAQLASVSVTMAALVGICARNFGLDRLVTFQSLLVGLPLCTGLLLVGDAYHVLLATLFAPTLISFRSVAGDVREVLLTAVHDRVEVSKLAGELDTAMTTMSHGLVMLDEQLNIIVANDYASDMLLQGQHGSVVGMNFTDIIARAEREGTLTALAAQRLATAITENEPCKLVLQLADGSQCEVSINSNENQITLVLEDISERVAIENRIKYMARYDGLTGLPNRTHFSELVDRKLTESEEYSSTDDVMMMIVDVDDFKHINDTLGHPIGDKVLQMLSERLRSNLDPHILLGRFGGDEFTVFADRDLTTNQAKEIASRLMIALREPFEIRGESIQVQLSIGYVVTGKRKTCLDDLLKKSDLALYASKSNGKNQWFAFHSKMDEEYNERQVLKSALREALRDGGLSLAYQPIVDVQTRKIVGCEALARWHHAEHGTIPPGIFIPIAEEIGVITELTNWVLHTATRECATWGGDIFVAVNISARDFKANAVQKMVRSALRQSELSPSRLEVEVTETVLIEELDTAKNALCDLSESGVRIALDDFGTGYSSLSYVHDMPFSKLKIDRAFTIELASNAKSRKLMRSIAHMSKELDMVVTVEGIETEEQLEIVASLGLIDQIQGFLFGVPLPQREIAQLLGTMMGRAVEPDEHFEIDSGRRQA